MRNRHLAWSIALCALFVAAHPALAQTMSFDLGEGGSSTGRIIQLLVLTTVLSLAPAIHITITSITRIIIVLSFLRNALGIQQTPPNTVLVSLALFLTGFIMAPTFEASYRDGVGPLIEGSISEADAMTRTVVPLHAFMTANVRAQDLKLFADIAKMEPVAEP